jgi:hypothetical protein
MAGLVDTFFKESPPIVMADNLPALMSSQICEIADSIGVFEDE